MLLASPYMVQFAGYKVENPSAVALPLKLAVVLLKDADGKIKIDVPISGSLDDPKFSVSVLVEDALYELLKRPRAIEINQNTDKKIGHEYVEQSGEDYQRLLVDRSLLGSPQLINAKVGDFYEAAKQKLFTMIKPEKDRLKRLAIARAQVIANYMVQQGIDRERLFMLDTVINSDPNNKELAVVLSLNSN